MPYPTTLTGPVPLAGLALDARAQAALDALRRHGADAALGLDEATVPLVAHAAAEPGIVEFCPNDRTRFADGAAARSWVAKGRAFVAVRAATGDRALLAYGWSGEERNDHIPGADVTTAYRVTDAGQSFARAVRETGDRTFRLGLLLGELVVATAIAVGDAVPARVSLETWGSNAAARRVYADLGFVQPDGCDEVPATRPTRLPVGADAAGSTVRADPETGGHVVDDVRCFYVLRRD